MVHALSSFETADDTDFFARLPPLADFDAITDTDAYHDAPESWYVALTDVRGSTRAIEAGRYRDVNALGVASIVAVCNALPDIDLPYVFGGDGSTLLVPGSRVDACVEALRGVARLGQSAYGLELRAGIVPLSELARAGFAVRVARFQLSSNVCLAMFSGLGLPTAERWLKDPARGERYLVRADGHADVSVEGFECRWQPVNSRRGSIVSLLVQGRSLSDEHNARIYRQVLQVLSEAQSLSDAHPLTVSGLKLRVLGGDYSTEARLLSGSAEGPRYEQASRTARKQARIGRLLIGLGASAGGFDGGSYKNELVENTDFRKFDGMLRMVLDLGELDIERLTAFLEEERAAGRLYYGLHRAPSALVTCFVRSYAGNHLHFVDGADGGYALAAKALKAQLVAL
jgi:DUF3095 family protein